MVERAGPVSPAEPPSSSVGSNGKHHRIEIVHESLLSHWPRLARWRSEDTEGAQLRDELRQAAHTWEQHGMAEDYLWTGAAYLDYRAWRERYPGGLTAQEEAFSRAMVVHAGRHKRRRRTAVTSALLMAMLLAAAMTGLWIRSEAQARRAKATTLLSIAKTLLDDHPTAAVAYATASLERFDTREARLVALEALWKSPPETRLAIASLYSLDFSPDGRWLATASRDGGRLWPSDGGPPRRLDGSQRAMEVRISPHGDLIAATVDSERQTIGLWSIPEGRALRSFALGPTMTFPFRFSPTGERVVTLTLTAVGEETEVAIRSWPVEGGDPAVLARWASSLGAMGFNGDIDPTGSRVVRVEGDTLEIRSLEEPGVAPVFLGHGQPIAGTVFDPRGQQVVTFDNRGTFKVWSLGLEAPTPRRTLEYRGTGYQALRFDETGSFLAHSERLLWRLDAPPDAEPLRLQIKAGEVGREAENVPSFGLAFDPRSRWLATGSAHAVSLWPLTKPYPVVLSGHELSVEGLEFTADGSHLVSISFGDGTVRLWPLEPDSGERSRILSQATDMRTAPFVVALSPDGSKIVTGSTIGRVAVLPVAGGAERELSGFVDVISAVAVGPEGRLVAAGAGQYMRDEGVVRVWDLESGAIHVLEGGRTAVNRLEFIGGRRLLAASDRFRLWNLGGEAPELLAESGPIGAGWITDIGPRGRSAILRSRTIEICDLETETVRALASHGDKVKLGVFDPSGEIVVSGDLRGIVRVGSARGDEPHLLLGHRGEITSLAVSPDGRWIASGGSDAAIRLWPMPDLSQRPLHRLPREDLLAELRSMTNLRAVEDPGSASGWKLEIGPFPGWEEVPEW